MTPHLVRLMEVRGKGKLWWLVTEGLCGEKAMHEDINRYKNGRVLERHDQEYCPAEPGRDKVWSCQGATKKSPASIPWSAQRLSSPWFCICARAFPYSSIIPGLAKSIIPGSPREEPFHQGQKYRFAKSVFPGNKSKLLVMASVHHEHKHRSTKSIPRASRRASLTFHQ